MVVVNHLLIRDLKIGDVSLDASQHFSFIDESVIQVFFAHSYTEKFGFLSNRLAAYDLFSFDNLLLDVVPIYRCSLFAVLVDDALPTTKLCRDDLVIG